MSLKTKTWINLQSPHEFRWVLVTRVSSICRVAAPLFHHQPVFNVHVQGILGHNLVSQPEVFNRHAMDALVLGINFGFG